MILLDEFWFRFWEYWHCEKFMVGLDEYVHDVCGKSLLACVNFVLWTWQNLVGMCIDIFVSMENFWTWEKFYRHAILTMEKFCWVYDVGLWKICVVMILAM